jgi:hypothetical protein
MGRQKCPDCHPFSHTSRSLARTIACHQPMHIGSSVRGVQHFSTLGRLVLALCIAIGSITCKIGVALIALAAVNCQTELLPQLVVVGVQGKGCVEPCISYCIVFCCLTPVSPWHLCRRFLGHFLVTPLTLSTPRATHIMVMHRWARHCEICPQEDVQCSALLVISRQFKCAVSHWLNKVRWSCSS